MSYQTGTALDVNDLLDRFRLFLIANGWAVNFWGDRLGGFGKALQVNRGGNFFSLFSDTTVGSSGAPGPAISLMLHTAYSDAGNPVQPGASNQVRGNRISAPMQAYHFFIGTGPNGDYAYMVVETDPGTFRHFGVGTLRKMGSYTGGQFAFASSWYTGANQIDLADSSYHGYPFDDGGSNSTSPATVIRADYGGVSPRYHYVDAYNQAVYPRARGGWRRDQAQYGTVGLPYRAAASVLTGRAPLIPLWVAVDRGSDLWSDIGYPVDMRLVRLDNMEPGQEYPLGTDTWLVFPAARKNGGAGNINSGVYGYAYRRTN